MMYMHSTEVAADLKKTYILTFKQKTMPYFYGLSIEFVSDICKEHFNTSGEYRTIFKYNNK